MSRDWSNERWVKLYTRKEPEWVVLPWWVRGLFDELLTLVDRAGVMKLGKAGRRAVAASLSTSWDEMLEKALKMLEDDGAIIFVGDVTKRDTTSNEELYLVIPNFEAAQEATSNARIRKAKEREKRQSLVTERDAAHTKRDEMSRESTERDRGVTFGHTESRDVTTRLDKTRVEEKPPVVPHGGQPELKLVADEVPTPLPIPPPSPGLSAADKVFEHWRVCHMPKAKKTQDRMRRIRARLKEGYSVEDLCRASDGVLHDDWLMGCNDRETQYRDIVTIFKSGAMVDKLIGLADAAEASSVPGPDNDYPEDPPGTEYSDPPAGFLEGIRHIGRL